MEPRRSTALLATLASLTIFSVPSPDQAARTLSPIAPTEKPILNLARRVPFAIDGRDSATAQAVAFFTADRMSAADREIEANAEPAIAERAKYSGLEFTRGRWSFEQIVCAALPEHMFLRFSRNGGTGDVSLFTASIPRGNQGRIRIIPIRRRGYSLFTPASVNAITVSAFNSIRAEENPNRAPVADWLGTGLCYAALAGANPKLPPAGEDRAHLLMTIENSSAVISFDDLSNAARPMRWTMTFNGTGRLLKAAHSKAELLKVNTLHPAPVDQSGKPASLTQPQQHTEAIPAGPNPIVQHPAPPPPAVKSQSPSMMR